MPLLVNLKTFLRRLLKEVYLKKGRLEIHMLRNFDYKLLKAFLHSESIQSFAL